MTKAIYAFSGDPITYGHIDIVKRAARIFNELIIAIGDNSEKKYMFSLEEREDMARRVLANIPNVKVVSFKGLLVDYAYESGVKLIVKGLRDIEDYNYEVLLHQLGESQKLGVETLLIPARQNLAHVSSSAVKALQQAQGMIHEYVPLYVKQKLESTISDQYIVEVTGEIGSGKTYISKELEKFVRGKGIECHHIDFDKVIVQKILCELEGDSYQKVRDQLFDIFGKGIRLDNGMVNKKELGELVFGAREKLIILNEVMRLPILNRLRKEIYGKKGLIILDAALFAEVDMLFLSNNNVILTQCNRNSQEIRLLDRDLNKEQVQRRIDSQFNYEGKKAIIEKQIKEHNQGHLWIYENSLASDSTQWGVKFEEILKYFQLR
jgi:pantetheine-phosphate adenylyltransferase/dephospho-CoA kinase